MANIPNNSTFNLNIVDLNAKEDFKHIEWTEERQEDLLKVIQHAAADIYILPDGLSDLKAPGYRAPQFVIGDGPSILCNENTVKTNHPNIDTELIYSHLQQGVAVYPELTVVSTNRSFNLATWRSVLFAEAAGLAAYKIARALHACTYTTDNPVICVGSTPANTGDIQQAVKLACIERNQQYSEQLEHDENTCDDGWFSNARVMKEFQDLNKFNVIGNNSSTNACKSVIASRSLKIAPPYSLNLDNIKGLNWTDCSIQDFRPTNTSVTMTSRPTSMIGG